VSKSKTDRKKQKRKAKKKKIKTARAQRSYRENGWFSFYDAEFGFETGDMDYAVKAIKKAAKILTNEERVFLLMCDIGLASGNGDLELYAFSCLEKMGKLHNEMKIRRIPLLYNAKRYKECLQSADNLLKNFTRVKIKDKRKTKKTIEAIREYCTFQLQAKEKKEIFEENSQYSGSVRQGRQKNTPASQKKSGLKNYGKDVPKKFTLFLLQTTKTIQKYVMGKWTLKHLLQKRMVSNSGTH